MPIITAIHMTKTRKAWSDEFSMVPMAWKRDENGREEFVEIDRPTFDMLLDLAGPNDYRENGTYVAFAEPVEIDDEPTDEEWYAELESGYMRDIGAGNFR